MEWASRLQSPAAPYRGSSGEKGTRISMEEGDFSLGEHGSEFNPLLAIFKTLSVPHL